MRDEELLALRIRDVHVPVEESPLAPRVAALYGELEARGLSLRPPCYLGDEWFSPEDEPVIGMLIEDVVLEMGCGSVRIGTTVKTALALLEERLLPDEAYEAACVDEIYQLKTWGEDEIARRRLDTTKHELGMIVRFNNLLRASS